MLLKDVKFKCPHCKSIVSQIMAASGNTMEAKFYSDGKTVGPYLLDDDRSIFLCPICSNYIWFEEAKLPSFIDKTFNSDTSAKLVEFEDHLKLLDTKYMEDPAKELHIRRRIWWGFNDRLRDESSSVDQLITSETEKDIWKTNLQRLIEIHQNEGSDEYDSMVLAELLRQANRFDDSMKMLDEIDNEELQRAKQKIYNACKEKNPYLIRI